MKTPARRRPTLVRLYPVLIGLLILVAAVLMAPTHSADSSRLRSGEENLTAKAVKSNLTNRFQYPGWISPLILPAVAGETAEVFAADCVTPKATFNVGETVCAKTDGVDLTTTPGNYYMNWVDSSLNDTNGGTITQNPQYFLFVPTTTGTWKATIGSLAPADSSIISTPPTFTVNQGPALSTFDPTCATPKTTFTLGETVCVKVSGVDPTFNRRFSWVDTEGNIRDTSPVTTDPNTDTFVLPTAETETIDDVVVDNRGTWRATIISSRGAVRLTARFLVQAQTPSTDLSIGKGLLGGQPSSGGDVIFSVSVFNRGPNDAENVVITDVTPANAAFQSVTQTSGPTFNCTGTSTVTCTGSILKARDTVSLEFKYTAGGTGTSITNTASVESDTAEIDEADNSATAGPFTIGQATGGGGDQCELTCPGDITVTANTTEGGQPGAHVNYSPAQSTGTCGAITYTHASGDFFPVGDTVVTATSETGDGSCSFRIRVEEAGNTSISCPANQTTTANAACEANLSAGTATGTGTNVTVIGTRSDGKPMYTCDEFGNCTRNSSDAPFPAGTTTITWIAYSHDTPGPYDAQTGDEESHRAGSASCTQTIVVDDLTAPTIAATDQTIAADASCQAVVPDYLSTVSDNCACASSDTSEACEDRSDFTYTQSPAAGTVVGLGAHPVVITANDRSSNNNGAGNESTKTITLTVADQTVPSISCPANIVSPSDPGSCSAVIDPGTATASDNCDSSPAIVGTRSDSQPLNAPYPKGTTTITWRATDDAGNYSECTQTVTVNDEEPPTISCPANITVYLPPNTTDTSMVVNYTAPVGQDNCAGSTTTQQAGLASGSAFPVGTTTNTFRVTDASGNYAECSFTVTVLYNFTGFFSPVSNPPAFNNVNAGRAVPVKFSLSGNKGLGIFAADYPMSQQIACDSSAPLSELEGTITSGGSTLTYSPDQYHYSWKTDSSWAGTCRVLIVKLNDGTEHTALFKFK